MFVFVCVFSFSMCVYFIFILIFRLLFFSSSSLMYCVVQLFRCIASPDATWSRVQTEKKIQKQIHWGWLTYTCIATPSIILWTNELGNKATTKDREKKQTKPNIFICWGIVVAHVYHLPLPFFSIPFHSAPFCSIL